VRGSVQPLAPEIVQKATVQPDKMQDEIEATIMLLELTLESTSDQKTIQIIEAKLELLALTLSTL
jgi:hypothetical protein